VVIRPVTAPTAPPTAAPPGGLGMGLSICRSIIEAHQGRVWVTANLPRGAVFQFTLPPERDETIPAEHAGPMAAVRVRRSELIELAVGDERRDRLAAQFKFALSISDEDSSAAPGLVGVISPAARRRPER
jgi:hypothetical protein